MAAAISNIFVLMLENRSFDHMLGFSEITGTDAVSGEKSPVSWTLLFSVIALLDLTDHQHERPFREARKFAMMCLKFGVHPGNPVLWDVKE
jgi:phospholipase C